MYYFWLEEKSLQFVAYKKTKILFILLTNLKLSNQGSSITNAQKMSICLTLIMFLNYNKHIFCSPYFSTLLFGLYSVFAIKVFLEKTKCFFLNLLSEIYTILINRFHTKINIVFVSRYKSLFQALFLYHKNQHCSEIMFMYFQKILCKLFSSLRLTYTVKSLLTNSIS